MHGSSMARIRRSLAMLGISMALYKFIIANKVKQSTVDFKRKRRGYFLLKRIKKLVLELFLIAEEDLSLNRVFDDPLHCYSPTFHKMHAPQNHGDEDLRLAQWHDTDENEQNLQLFP